MDIFLRLSQLMLMVNAFMLSLALEIFPRHVVFSMAIRQLAIKIWQKKTAMISAKVWRKNGNYKTLLLTIIKLFY